MPDGCCETLFCHIRLFRGRAHIFVWYLSTTLDVRMSASVFTSKPYIKQLCADSLLPSAFRLNCLLSINLRVYVYSYVECVLVVWL